MLTVTAIKNPLDPFASQVSCQMLSGLPVDHYISALLPNIPDCYDLVVSVDGRQVDPQECPMLTDGQSLALVVVPQGGGGGGGGGKMVARIVATIGIAIASYFTAGYASSLIPAVWGTTAAGIAGATAGAATMMAGSMIINAVLPIQTASGQAAQQSSPTYGWSVTGNAILEGNALPALYGTMRVVPPRISINTSMSGQAQTLGLLFAVAGHYVDSIEEIEINDTGELATNYPDVIAQAVQGTNNGPVMPGFDDTMVILSGDVGLPGNKLTTSWRTITTQGNAVTAMQFGFIFYGGLYGTSTDDQGTYPVGCSIKLEYSPHGANTWTRMQTMYEVETVLPTAQWSGGYWTLHNSAWPNYIWVEIEAGSLVAGDHTEGDPYTPPDDTWITTWFHSPDDPRPWFNWHWLPEGTRIVRSTDYHPWVGWTENNTNPLRYTLSTYSLPAGQYDIRVALYDSAQESTPPTTTKDLYWEYYAEIIEDDFAYPNVAKLALRSVASSKLANEIPRVSCLVNRPLVYVYDPDTSAWVSKAATNPAWASYDAIVGAQRIVDINAVGYDPADPDTWTYVMYFVGAYTYDKVIYADFEDWADWCDLVAPSGYPDKKAYTCNLYLDTTTNLRKALDMIGLCGRGLAIQVGSKWSCVVDKPESTAVQRFCFNMANIERDSFSEQWLSTTDRANCLEMVYYPADNNYRPKSFEIRQVGYESSTQEAKRISVDYRGCNNFDMALAFGKYLLNCNRYLTLTCSFTADIDSIACFPGQIIELQHDVPQFGYGGRLLANCTDTILLLDTPMTMITGKTYHIVIYHQEDDLREEAVLLPIAIPAGSVWRGTWDGGETYAVGDAAYFVATTDYRTKTAEPNTWTVCPDNGSTEIAIVDETVEETPAANLTRAPSQYCKFNFGEVEYPGLPAENWKVSKLVRVLSITRASDQRRKLTCIEFVNEVFQDGATINASNPSDLPRIMVPPALASVSMEIAWKLEQRTKQWEPYVRVTFVQDQTVDYTNLAIPISKVRIYAHKEEGDTHLVPKTTGTYEAIFDVAVGVHDYPAPPLNGKTLYVTASLINQQGMEGPKCLESVYYVDTSYTPAPSTSNLTIGDYDWITNSNNYRVAISWVPYGWSLSGGKYAPILTWNSGVNYYVFDRYLVGYGYVAASGNYPALADMHTLETADIGNIFDASGAMITNADNLDSICRGAASAMITGSYCSQWLAMAVAPIMKNGSIGGIDVTQADYGLDWEWIQVTRPGGAGYNVEEVQIQNAELVYTMQTGTVFLSEFNWDYTLQSPYIDGFCVIFRKQPYLWSWLLNASIASNITSMVTIVNALDLTSGGGQAAASDFGARYAEWSAGGVTHFYVMIADATNYEIIKVTTATLTATRGVEGTTARAWSAGATFSYSPSEYIDTIALINDTAQRSFVFNPPFEVDEAIHSTIVAFKRVPDAPGYKRSYYAYWDTVRNR